MDDLRSLIEKQMGSGFYDEVLDLKPSHKKHPLAALLGATCGAIADGHRSQVSINTARAMQAIMSKYDSTGSPVLADKLKKAASADFANSSAALGEIRTWGWLLLSDIDTAPVPVSTSKTPDFSISAGDATAVVEVHTKQMNDKEARGLRDFLRFHHSEPVNGKGLKVREHATHPGGRPKVGETVTENVISKFAGIKPRAEQAKQDIPSVLWLDLQDEDWWALSPEHARPVTITQGEFYSGPLWYAAYGRKGLPFFEHCVVEERAAEFKDHMKFEGLFCSRRWSGIVLAFPSCTVYFESPNPMIKLPSTILVQLFGMPWFSWNHSEIGWPLDEMRCWDRVRNFLHCRRAIDIEDRIESRILEICVLSKKVRFCW